VSVVIEIFIIFEVLIAEEMSMMDVWVAMPFVGSRVTSLRRKKFRMTCLGFTHSLPPETKTVSGA
jgi:hypothetical protein